MASNKKLVAIILLIISVSFFVYGTFLNESGKNTRQITGKSAVGTSSVSFRILSACNIYLKEGWNLVSICSNLTNKTIDKALNDINGSYRYVMEWNESNQSFLIFSPLAAQNPFTELKEDQSYFIYLLPLSGEINPTGHYFGDMNIPLIFGWNTPIYPYDFETGVEKYLETINESYRYVMKWNSTTQRFMIFSPLAAENEFYNISSGEGQFVYISNSSGATLKYNRTNLSG